MRLAPVPALCALLVVLPAFAQPAPAPLAPGIPLFYCAGNDVGFQPIVPPTEKTYSAAEVAAAAAHRAQLARQEGLTSLEVYIKWWLCEPEPGKWDFSYYDLWVQACRKEGLRLAPLLIVGPSYGTPPWFKQSPESLYARCLEHGLDTPTQSIWNPALRHHVTEFLSQFARHFDLTQIESLKLGISGDFGESIYPCGGNHWTYLGPEYHIHAGYWCGDDRAVADFAAEMRQRYGQVAALNAAWGTTFTSFAQVRPFLPETAPSRRARLDLQRWYCGAMTDFLEFWIATVRQLMPGNRINVSLGGDGALHTGADFSAQAAVAARYAAGIRITNEASDYPSNYMLTRHVSSCCRHYGTYFGVEPAGGVTTAGIPVRVYNATATGADELFTYDPEPAGERAAAYRAWRALLVKREPLVGVGLFLNQTSRELGLADWAEGARRLRAVTDYELLDDRLVAGGALTRLRALVWLAGPVVEAETYRKLRDWVSAGGLLLIGGLDSLETVEGDRAPARELLPAALLADSGVPERYSLDLGSPLGDRWLRGSWHGAENGMGLTPPDTSFRWTTPAAEVELPLPAAPTVTIAVRLIGAGPHPQEQVLQVDGVDQHRVRAGAQVALLRLSAADLAGKQTVRLRFAGADWKADGADTRRLGVAAVAVGVGKGDCAAEEVLAAPPLGAVRGLTPDLLAARYTRRVGAGAVVYLPATDADWRALVRAVVEEPGRFLPGATVPYPLASPLPPDVYLTRFRDGSALLLNCGTAATAVTYAGRTVSVPPHGLAEVSGR